MINYLSKILYVISFGKGRLFILLVSFLLISLLETLGIGLIGPFISLASNQNIIHQVSWLNWIYTHLGFKSASYFIACIGFLIIIIFCVKSFYSWRTQAAVFKFGYDQQGVLTSKLMHAYLLAPYTFHLERNTAQLVQNIINETRNFSNLVLIPLLTTTSNIIIALLLAILLTVTNLTTVVVILAMTLPLVIMFNSFKEKLSYWGEETSKTNTETIRIINHSFGGFKETKVIGCESYFEDQTAEQAQKYATAMSSYFAFFLLPRILVETVLVIFLVGFTSTYLLINQNIQGLISVLSVFALSSIRLMPAITNGMNGLSTLKNSSYTLNKLYFELKELERLDVDQKQKLVNQSNSSDRSNCKIEPNKAALTFAEKIVLDGIAYHYPNASENALKDVSLVIHKGQSIALIGKSGAGKTTLVDVILGLLFPNSGDIQVDGQSVYANLRSWQELIAYIPQSIFLMDDTVERNIAFGVPDHLIDSERLNKAIYTAQLTDLMDHLPDGAKTVIGERGVRLSGGQRQRIGIARALYHQREILVLDEATSALDNETEGLVTEAIKSLSGTKTMIIIAHRLTTVEHCDCIHLMEKGQIVKSGIYQEVVSGK